MRFALIIPTLNAEPFLDRLLPAIAAQTARPERILVIDSSSNDRTVERFREAGAEIITITRAEFNHGGTRNRGAEMVADLDVVLFLTQDAIPATDDAFARLLAHFDNDKVSVVYGRQLPREQAGPIEWFARTFSYPAETVKRGREDIPKYGFRTSFCSNSFAAYRIVELRAVGGFPADTIFGEDALAVSQIILKGGLIVYAADAAVVHSHEYSVVEEFRRYFDIGVMHSRAHDLLGKFGSARSEGFSFVKNELTYLSKTSPLHIPEALVRTGAKYVAYKMGSVEKWLPLSWKRPLSMHRRYWQNG